MNIGPVSAPGVTGAAYDHDRAAAAVRELLIAIGEDPEREGLKETPERVARAYAELTAGLRMTPADVLSTTDPHRPPGDETHKWHSKVTLMSRSFTLLRRAE